jgi:hypothetical protein
MTHFKIGVRGVLGSFLLTALLGIAGIASAEPIPDLSALSSGGQHCSSLLPLAQWLGAEITWITPDQEVNLSYGQHILSLRAGLILASDREKLMMLPTCPFRRDGVFYVPTRFVVESLGGSLLRNGSQLSICFEGRNGELPPAPASAPAGVGLERIRHDLLDPRVPLDDMAPYIKQQNDLHQQIQLFSAIAGPVQAGLKLVGESKVITLLGHTPVIGSWISLCQDSTGAIGEILGISVKLAEFDKQAIAPITLALETSGDLKNQLTPGQVRASRKSWQDAVTALDKQLKYNETTTKYLKGMSSAMLALDRFAQSNPRLRNSPGGAPPSIQPTLEAGKIFGLLLDAQHWYILTFKDYFQTLLNDSRGI